jgi:hypothetical protein
MRDIRLGPALFVPNGSLGSFGSVTTRTEPLKNHKDLWDFAAAGPICGLAVGLGLFAYGIVLSSDPTTDPNVLIPVPTFLFQVCFLAHCIVAPCWTAACCECLLSCQFLSSNIL